MAIPNEHKEVLAKAAEKTAAAAPKTPSAVVTFFKVAFMPALPGLVSILLQNANAKTRAIFRQVRDTLDAADLD
jgi:hypothetical protein